MKTSDFYYDLPEELIAQTPVETARFFAPAQFYHRDSGRVEHRVFGDVTPGFVFESGRRDGH